MFLGDIIELACRNAGLPSLSFDQGDGGNIKTDSIFATYNPTADQINKTSFPLKNAGIILGPLEYINKDGIAKTINLARMPISFKFFKSLPRLPPGCRLLNCVLLKPLISKSEIAIQSPIIIDIEVELVGVN